MKDPERTVVEFVLTTTAYNERKSLDADDLPAAYRSPFWSDGRIERPLSPTVGGARTATGVDQPWEAVSGLMFTDYDDFSGTLSFTDQEMAEQWYLDRVDDDRLEDNPVLADYFADTREVSYERASERNRPARADREFIDSLLDEYFDDEEEEEMLDLVDIRAPEEIEQALDEIVLTSEQEGEIQKIVKAIEHREYLASIGLREIGKLLFVGPPGQRSSYRCRVVHPAPVRRALPGHWPANSACLSSR
jgi:hypothetical protein